MSLQTLSEWLRCPICFQDLAAREPLILACVNGHAFDVNKRGYVSLIAGSRKLQADNPAMLDARDRFLGAGWYSQLRETLADAVAEEKPSRVIDIGCGTGYYLDGVLHDDTRATAALGMDLSPTAVARTVRGVGQRHPSAAVDGLVADVWSPLPIRDATADVILNVFAPRNPPEFHRLLRADGILAIVVPQDTHLAELRSAGMMLDVQPDKAALLVDSLAGYFALKEQVPVATTMMLSPDDIAGLVGMGPSAHHHTGVANSGQNADHHRTVSAAFDLLVFRRITA
jgi:SAM-dependent methyltransferase